MHLKGVKKREGGQKKLIQKEVCRFAVMHKCQAFILLVKKGEKREKNTFITATIITVEICALRLV